MRQQTFCAHLYYYTSTKPKPCKQAWRTITKAKVCHARKHVLWARSLKVLLGFVALIFCSWPFSPVRVSVQTITLRCESRVWLAYTSAELAAKLYFFLRARMSYRLSTHPPWTQVTKDTLVSIECIQLVHISTRYHVTLAPLVASM
jgi:hypothetical protein